MPRKVGKMKCYKAGKARCQADINNHQGQKIENEEQRDRLRRILESRKAMSVNDQEKVQSAAPKDNGLYQLRTEVPPKIQRSSWELILMHLPSTKMLAQYLVEVLSTALNSLVAGLTSLKIWSTKSAKKRHLCASISAHSLHINLLLLTFSNTYSILHFLLEI